MRKALAALTVLAAALAVAPASTATSAGSGDADRVVEQTARVGTVATLRKRVVTLTNNRRANRGCRALRRVASLDRAAQKHSRRMANVPVLSHQLPGEPSVPNRMRNEGYNPALWGENVAAGSSLTTARAVVRLWMSSAGHRRNILKCGYKHTGVGLAYAAGGVPYWTQVFGRR